MMPAVKHLDPVLGIDIHLIITPPGAVVPIPHPHIGIVFDPFDYLPLIGSTVNVNGLPRAQAGTGGVALPPHFPIGGVFAKPPGNENETFMGSSTVVVDEEPFTYMLLPVLSCQDIGMPSPPRKKGPGAKTLLLPTSIALSIPAGPPVIVGGAPTISMAGLLSQLAIGALLKGLKKLRKLQKASRKMKALSDRIHKAADKVMDKLGLGQRARNRVHRAVCSLTGHPVDIATGKVLTEDTDFVLPGPLPLVWRRVWYSTSTHTGELGHGWHHSYDMAVFPSAEAVVVRLDDGRHVPFAPPLPGGSSWNPQEHLILMLGPTGYVLQTDTGVRFHFQSPSPKPPELAPWPLVRIEDPCGNAISIERQYGRISQIIDSAGRRLSFQWDASWRITAIHGPDPANPQQRQPLVRYEYDKAGDLVAVHDAAGAAQRFSYLNHLLIQETSRDGVSFYFEYDRHDPSGRCIHTWGDGGVLERWLTYDLAGRTTTVLDSRGASTRYEWNELGLVTHQTDALGNEIRYTYDHAGALVSQVNALGEHTHHVRDEHGRVVCIEEPAGVTTRFTYDARGGLTEVLYPDGSKRSRVYDARGNLIEEKEPGGAVWRYEVDARGLRTKEVDPKGNTYTYAWSAAGDLTVIQDPLGQQTVRHHDALGRLVSRRDALGQETLFEYDACGRLTRIVEPGGAVRLFSLDAAGRVIKQTDALGHTRHHLYGPLGRCVATLDAAGASTRFEYDKELDLIGIRNPVDRKYRLQRDILGRIVEEDAFGRRHRYTYDGSNRLVSRTDARGLSTRYEYDQLGRCTKRVRDDGQEEIFKYDLAGRLIEAKNSAARVSRKYDRAGHLVAERINGEEVRYEYDAAGNRIARGSPLGRRLELSYDACGQLAEVAEASGPLLRMRHDALGRETELRYQGGAVRRREYTPSGRLRTSVISRDSEPLTYSAYSYDTASRLKAFGDEDSGGIQLTHDATGRLVRARYSDQTEELYSYDAAGNRLGAPEGKLLAEGPCEFTQEIFQLRYDEDGNLTEKQTPRSKLTHDYNTAGQLSRTVVTRASGNRTQVEYSYDPFGRRVLKRVREGNQIEDVVFLWDGDVLLGEKRTAWREETEGPATGSPPAGGTRSRSAREFLSLPESFQPLAVFDAKQCYFIESDANATPKLALDTAGRVAWRAELSGFGAARKQTDVSVDVPLRFPGQYEDHETGLFYNRFRYYDPALAMYISVDPLGYQGGLNLWNYVPSPADGRDPYGLVHETAPGYSVYGLYDPPGPPTEKPYYVGISNDANRRAEEHIASGRLDKENGILSTLDSDLDYGTARGYEQAYIDHHGTRTGEIGEPVSAKNRGNKVNSFVDNPNRRPERQAHFEKARREKLDKLAKSNTVCS
ncbi:MAG TPA: DUF6531 domain-containing protein [Archangium sp.]|nr:DUF6531 domain-containing protein [Archangium sp.]